MYYVMDAHSFYNFIYFILLIIVSVREAGALWASSRTHGPENGCGGESLGVPREPFTAKRAGWEKAGGAVLKMQLSQRVREGTCQGRLLEGSITSDCLHFSFLAFESTPWLLLLFLCLVVPGNTCFL